jgi:hypothetical protein
LFFFLVFFEDEGEVENGSTLGNADGSELDAKLRAETRDNPSFFVSTMTRIRNIRMALVIERFVPMLLVLCTW